MSFNLGWLTFLRRCPFLTTTTARLHPPSIGLPRLSRNHNRLRSSQWHFTLHLLPVRDWNSPIWLTLWRLVDASFRSEGRHFQAIHTQSSWQKLKCGRRNEVMADLMQFLITTESFIQGGGKRACQVWLEADSGGNLGKGSGVDRGRQLCRGSSLVVLVYLTILNVSLSGGKTFLSQMRLLVVVLRTRRPVD